MSNAIIVRPLAPAAISAITATVDGNVANVSQDPGADFMGLRWTSGTTTARFQIDMGADVTIDTIALLHVAGVTGSSVCAVLYATSAQGPAMNAGTGNGVNQYNSASVTTGFAGANPLANGRQAMFGVLSAPITARHFHIVVDPVTLNSFSLARVIVGQKIQLSRNFVFGAAYGVRSFGSVDYSDRGVPLRRQAPKLRGVGLTFSNTYRDEIEATVQPLLERVGNDTPILLVTDPDVHAERTKRIYFGHLDGDIGSIHRNAICWEWRANLVSLF